MKDESKYDWFMLGIESDFNMCCIFWFLHPWQSLEQDIKLAWTSTCDGYIPCPDCLVRYMEEENGKIV